MNTSIFIVILSGGDDLPQAIGPFENKEAALTFANSVPTVWDASVAELEDPTTWETN